jgi:hypothetical protein
MTFLPSAHTAGLIPLSRRLLAAGAVSLALSGYATGPLPANQPLLESFRTDVRPVLEKYCFDCHAEGSSKGGVAFDELDDASKIADHEIWLRALKNVRMGTMPPSDEAQPTEDEQASILKWIKQQAFALDEQQPDPGRVVVRRLNRVEYRNTIRDLLGVEFDTEAEFPADDSGHGFDNLGEVLTVSPTLVEKLLDASQKIIASAVPAQPREVAERSILGREFNNPTAAANPSPEPVPAAVAANPAFAEFYEAMIKAAKDAAFLSFYEVGSVQHILNAPMTGTYQLSWELQTAEQRMRGEGAPPDLNRCRVRFTIDGVTQLEREFERSGDRNFQLPIEVALTKGEHVLAMTVQPIASDAPQTRQLRMRLNAVKLRGPLEKEGWVVPARHREFFGNGVPQDADERRRYTVQLISQFARRAFRRPADDYTINRLVDAAERIGTQRGNSFERGISHAMVAILASPRFLFREEVTEPLQPGKKYPFVDEHSLASRLSYFLWSSMPDEELFRLADEGRLRQNFSAQFERMLRDPRSSRFVADFTGQWLQARDVANVVIDPLSVILRDRPNPELENARVVFRSLIEDDPIHYTPEEKIAFDHADKLLKEEERRPKPRLTGRLRRAMRQETEMMFEHIIEEDRSVLELIDTNYAFLNEELARHYGIEGVKGSEMRKVELPPDSPRGGVLTSGAVLTVTSNPTRTSPVKRGVFILDNILGMPPAPPPPNIPGLEDVASKDELSRMTMREQINLHAKASLCRSCHLRMDPLGLSLENFNALGVWRESEQNLPVDPSGELVTGEKFQTITDLKRILVTDRRRDFYYCLSEKLLIYALGRGPEYTDTTLLDELADRLEASGGRMSVLLTGLVQSAAFQQSRESSPSFSATADSRLTVADRHSTSESNVVIP